MANLKNLTINDSQFLSIPIGNSANRPTQSNNGDIRYNTERQGLELYSNNAWQDRERDQIVEDGLILWFDFGNTDCYPGTGTDVFDLSENGNNGSVSNSSVHSEFKGGFFSLDQEYINVPYSSQFNVDTITVEYIFKPLQKTHVRPFVNRGQGNPWRLLMSNPGADTINWQIRVNGDIYASTSNAAFSVDQVYHVVAGYDGNEVFMYVNSVKQNDLPQISGTISSDNRDIEIGRNADYSPDRFAKQEAFNLKIYNRALSQAEILQNFNAEKRKYRINSPGVGLNADSPAYSARDIQTSNPSASNGFYYMDLQDGRGSELRYVDFTFPNGPWVMVAQEMGSQSGNSATFGIQNTGSPQEAEPFTGTTHFNTNITNCRPDGYLVANNQKSFVYFDIDRETADNWFTELQDTSGETSRNERAFTNIGTTSGSLYYNGKFWDSWSNQETVVELHHGSWNASSGINYIWEVGGTARSPGSGGNGSRLGFQNQGSSFLLGEGTRTGGSRDYHFIRI